MIDLGFWIISLLLMYDVCQVRSDTYQLQNERRKRDFDPSVILGSAVDVGLTVVETFQRGAAIRGSSDTNIGIIDL